MPHVAELGLLASALAEQAGIGVGSRAMRVVLALLALEVALGSAPDCCPIACQTVERRSSNAGDESPF